MSAPSNRISATSLEGWLSLAEEVARSAGKFLAESRSRVEVVANLGKDIKLSHDRESETRIVCLLREHSDFPILSEEQGLIPGRATDREMRWIVDPLDGSLNYLRGIPFCCVSVGLWKGETPVLGAIYDFDRNELFTGIAESGAWLNGTAITVSRTHDPGDAVLCTGFPVGMDLAPAALLTFVEQVRRYKKCGCSDQRLCRWLMWRQVESMRIASATSGSGTSPPGWRLCAGRAVTWRSACPAHPML